MNEWEGLPPGEPIKGKTYRADGWVYRDVPTCSFEAWDDFITILEKDNYVILVMSKGPNRIRGQILISPKGMENAQRFHDA